MKSDAVRREVVEAYQAMQRLVSEYFYRICKRCNHTPDFHDGPFNKGCKCRCTKAKKKSRT